jgi:hypothetical protein
MILLSWECPRLNQAFDSDRSSGSSIWNNPITRRSFLKKSGGATVGAVILMNTLGTTQAQAETTEGSVSCQCHVLGKPNDAQNGYNETGVATYNGWKFKGKYFTSPYDGTGSAVTVSTKSECWIFDLGAVDSLPAGEYFSDEDPPTAAANATIHETVLLVLTGTCNNCNFTAFVDPPDILNVPSSIELRRREYEKLELDPDGGIPIYQGWGFITYTLWMNVDSVLVKTGQSMQINGSYYITYEKSFYPSDSIDPTIEYDQSEPLPFVISVEKVTGS